MIVHSGRLKQANLSGDLELADFIRKDRGWKSGQFVTVYGGEMSSAIDRVVSAARDLSEQIETEAGDMVMDEGTKERRLRDALAAMDGLVEAWCRDYIAAETTSQEPAKVKR